MPNYCFNTIRIVGGKEKLEKLLNDIRYVNDQDETVYNITRAYKCPSELDMIHRGGAKIDGAMHKRWYYLDKNGNLVERSPFQEDDDEVGKPIGMTEGFEKELIEKFGFADGFDFRTEMWGTKWVTDCEDYREWLEDDDESDLNFECESAWSPPLQLLHKIIEKYDLKYATCRWWEEGGYTGWDVVDLEDGIHSITN